MNGGYDDYLRANYVQFTFTFAFTINKRQVFMANAPLVSIITIVYNGEKHLEQTIKSVIEQTYPNIEYLVIDGGSTDGSLSIIRQYEKHIDYWISEKDRGISDAFNKGLRNAKGEIIGMINADDWYERETVGNIVASIGNRDIAYGDLRLFKDGKTDFILRGNHKYLAKEMTINHPTVFVRKSCYERFGLFDEKYKVAMDYDLMLRFMVNACQFSHIPTVLANMRWEGLSDANWMIGCRETLDIKNNYFPEHRFRNQLYYYKHLMAIGIPKFLQKLRLDSLTKSYRSNFSRVKKHYD
jgi:glycosyltransferase involved in cell wall biosynthesis